MNLSRSQFSISLCFLILSFSNFVYSQKGVIMGKVISENDSIPVSYAEISINGKSIGTITNIEGRFTLSNIGSADDSICISHISYETKKLALTELKPEENIISLKAKVYSIGEIAIQGESVVDILKKSISQSREAIVFPMRLETYYREFVQQNNQYTKFSDGLLNYDLLGTVDKVKTKVQVVQSRAKEIKNETDKEIDWDLTSPLDVGKALSPFFLSRLQHIVENSNLYDFHMLSRMDNKNQEQIEIKYSPKPGNPEPLYQGVVLIDTGTKYILSFTCNLEQDLLKPGKEKNLILIKIRILQYSSTVLFKLEKTNYQSWYTSTRVGLRLWNNKKFDMTVSFLSDLLVNNIIQTSFDQIPNKEAFNKKALYTLGDNYQSEYWKGQNTIQLTTTEEKIIDQLR